MGKHRQLVVSAVRLSHRKGINLLGATQGTKAGLEEVIQWVSKGKIKPVIDTILPFNNMVEGHLKMADSQLFGKILTTPQKL